MEISDIEVFYMSVWLSSHTDFSFIGAVYKAILRINGEIHNSKPAIQNPVRITTVILKTP